MKNKKLVERIRAEEHKNRLSQIKAKRRGEPLLERSKPSLKEKPIILIYCEGENTEPSYFNQFRIPSITVNSFGEGRNTLSLVRRAIYLSKLNKYDQVWCVFDADPVPGNPNRVRDFNQAIKLAKRNSFGVAYSNQAFEYWIILHFEDHQGTPLNRNRYKTKINSYLNPFGVYYNQDGKKIISQEIFNLLMAVIAVDHKGRPQTRMDLAIRRAERIYNQLDHANPGKEESSTTVFKLAQELKKNM